MINKYIIYVFSDPRTNEIRYVGRSSNGLSRPKREIKDVLKKLQDGSFKCRRHVSNWIRLVVSEGLDVCVSVIEVFEAVENVNDILNDAEIFYISYFRSIGMKLTNETDGGGGMLGRTGLLAPLYGRTGTLHPAYGKPGTMLGKKHTEETLKKMSFSHSGKNNSMFGKTGELAPMFGRKHVERTKKKMRDNSPTKGMFGIEHPSSKPVECLTDRRRFDSILEATRFYKLNPNSIGKVCRGSQKYAGDGLIFRFLQKEKI